MENKGGIAALGTGVFLQISEFLSRFFGWLSDHDTDVLSIIHLATLVSVFLAIALQIRAWRRKQPGE